MKKSLFILVGLGGILSGCSKKLNDFEYADITQQVNVTLLDWCTSSYFGNYCKILKNGDIVYFDALFESDMIINPKSETDYMMKIISVVSGYESLGQIETSTYDIEEIQEMITLMKKDMKKHGLGDNLIYVMQDANGDLVFRMTNGKVDYNYFDSDEAREIYENYLKK